MAGDEETAIAQFVGEILASESDDDYQGDTFIVAKGPGYFCREYLFITFGWGSCSGCDAWQAALDDDDAHIKLAELTLEVLKSAKKFESLAKLKAYVADDEARKGEFFFRDETWKKFAEKVAALKKES